MDFYQGGSVQKNLVLLSILVHEHANNVKGCFETGRDIRSTEIVDQEYIIIKRESVLLSYTASKMSP